MPEFHLKTKLLENTHLDFSSEEMLSKKDLDLS